MNGLTKMMMGTRRSTIFLKVLRNNNNQKQRPLYFGGKNDIVCCFSTDQHHQHHQHQQHKLELEEEGKEKKGAIDWRTRSKAWLELSKAKLSMLVVSTSAFGYLAAGGDGDMPTLMACAVGTALCSSSAASLNQIYEIDRDAKMKRTRNRPLVKGVIDIKEALAFGSIAGVGGTSLLYFGTDIVTASLGFANIALYSGLYTYLKPRSELNTWVGAVVGAIPPVMGYSAATGGQDLLSVEAAILASTLYLWQFPHFFALSWMHRQDYARGGFQMVPVNDDINGTRTSKLITNYTRYLSTLPILSTALEITTPMFAVEGIALNAYALYVAHRFDQHRTNANARKVFFTSLWYLPSFMVLFLLHSNSWKQTTDENNNDDKQQKQTPPLWKTYVQDILQKINYEGRQLCLHEQVITTNTKNDGTTPTNTPTATATAPTISSCPVTMGKAKAKQVADDVSQVVVATTTLNTSTNNITPTTTTSTMLEK